MRLPPGFHRPAAHGVGLLRRLHSSTQPSEGVGDLRTSPAKADQSGWSAVRYKFANAAQVTYYGCLLQLEVEQDIDLRASVGPLEFRSGLLPCHSTVGRTQGIDEA